MNLDPTATHLPVFKTLFAEHRIVDVLEFGCGLFSTKKFHDMGCRVTSIEMQNRDLFDLAGGFDEEYMGGAGYEDRDLVCRLLASGARFMVRDDLVVHHPKTGATIKWPAEGFARNEQIFKRKWPNH